MGKIATKQYVNSLLNRGTISDGIRCATKSWITGNSSSVSIAGAYQDDQLVKEGDLQVQPSLETIFGPYSGTTSGRQLKIMSKAFDLYKAFEISGTVVWNSVVYADGTAVAIYEKTLVLYVNVLNADTSNPTVMIAFRNSANNGWVQHTEALQYGKSYTFSIKSDGTTITTICNGVVSVATDYMRGRPATELLCLTGSPYNANGSCNATITNLIIKN